MIQQFAKKKFNVQARHTKLIQQLIVKKNKKKQNFKQGIQKVIHKSMLWLEVPSYS